MAKVRIGISGWRYSGWRGEFYPADLVHRDELYFASRCFRSIELNGSFYSLQRPRSYARWRDQTPHGFVFAVKEPRFITHTRRLRNVEVPLANFFASGVFELRGKLGPILWQLPSTLRFDHEAFARFLDLLPHDTRAASRLARRRDARMKGRARLAIDRNRRMRHAVEIRHASFLDASFTRLLRDHGVALVVSDSAKEWPYVEEVTAEFMYLRLHGDVELYASGYTDAALDRWAKRVRAWKNGSQPRGAKRVSGAKPPRRTARDVYCYFDNDAKVHAPFDAMKLSERLGDR
jgi:uncharacterized protein YecE (DUF72 family)